MGKQLAGSKNKHKPKPKLQPKPEPKLKPRDNKAFSRKYIQRLITNIQSDPEYTAKETYPKKQLDLI